MEDVKKKSVLQLLRPKRQLKQAKSSVDTKDILLKVRKCFGTL